MRSTKQSEQDHSEPEKQSRRQKGIELGKQVLCSLGEPTEFFRIVVRHLWDDCYRVNVFVGTDIVDCTIQHSFFVVLDRAGLIMSSTPAIARRYEQMVKRP